MSLFFKKKKSTKEIMKLLNSMKNLKRLYKIIIFKSVWRDFKGESTIQREMGLSQQAFVKKKSKKNRIRHF